MIGVVILAAGESKRMGRPKLLLPWGKNSVLGHLIWQWQALGASQIGVVCAEHDDTIQAELNRIGFPAQDRIINVAPQRGMFSSIQSASQWNGWKTDLTHWAIVLGDQPHLHDETLRRIIEVSRNSPDHICVPRQGGHRRHPVVLPREAFITIANTSSADLRAFLNDPPVPVKLCDVDDPALELDIDNPEDYEIAVRRYLPKG
jgi:molybdenum cofactor cytidylyltransferase